MAGLGSTPLLKTRKSVKAVKVTERRQKTVRGWLQEVWVVVRRGGRETSLDPCLRSWKRQTSVLQLRTN